MTLRTWWWAIVALAALCSTAMALDGRKPGSVLVYPIHRSGSNFTILSVTNTALEAQTPFVLGGSTGIAWRYINVTPGTTPLLPQSCSLIERIGFLTPGDTTAVLAACQNATGYQEGFVVIAAQDPSFFQKDWSHNFLLGSEVVINAAGGIYILDAVPFTSPQPRGSHTDDVLPSANSVGQGDGDEQIDFDGLEYEGVPDHLFADSFLASPGSSLTLLNLSGGAYFTAAVALDIWNDDEHPLSYQFQFRCWFEERLVDLSPVFSQQYLSLNTPNDPTQLDWNCDDDDDQETGWFRVRGVQYSSPVDTCLNPALLGAITAGPVPPPTPLDGGHLLWESDQLQFNGDFYKFSTDDPECPEPLPKPPQCSPGDPGPRMVMVGETVVFDGSGSVDRDGQIELFEWDFGDGNSMVGAVVSHAYAAPGDYTAVLTIEDDEGLTSTCPVAVEVNAPPLCDAGPERSGNVGQVLVFDGSASTDPGGTIVRFDWDFGDGAAALNAGPMPSHAYAAPGDYVVGLTVTDDGGASTSCMTAAHVNDAPTCDAGPEQFGNVGDTLTFDGSGSSDADGTIVRYDWVFGDGSSAMDAGPTPSHLYSQAGDFTVLLTVTDDDGTTSTCPTAAHVNAFPLCDAGPEQSGEVGDTFTFDGTGCSDPDGSIVRFDWDFGDGATAMDAGPTPSHVYTLSGDYVVMLTITDDDGATSTCPTAAHVNAPPLCDAGPAQSGNVGDTLTFDGSSSFDPDGSIVSFDWTFGDGASASNAGPMPSHVYATPGDFTVTLTITDDDGSVSICMTDAFVNAFPVCDAGPEQFGNVGDTLTFDGSGSSDPDGTIVAYDWLFGDGQQAANAGPNPSHVYSQPGDYLVTLRITDDDGAITFCTTMAHVNGFPVCDAGPEQSGNVGDLLTFDATGSSDADGSIVRYDWTFGDGSSAMDAGPTPSHVYLLPGDYTVMLTVTDDDGATSTCPTAAHVNAFPVCNAGPEQFGDLGDTFTFDATGSFDTDGTIVRYDWTFGDGASAQDAGPTPSHVYAQAGDYLVTVAITDDDGATVLCPTAAHVNAFPVCDAGPEQFGNVGDTLTFDGSGSSDPDGVIVSFDWLFGDGQQTANAGPSPSHVYSQPGDYLVTLRITDDDGAITLCTTMAHVNAFPTCDAGPGQSGDVGEVLTFDATGSSDSDGSIVRYDWDFGDGATAMDAGPTPGHAYSAAGDYTVTLVVTDDDGATVQCMTTAHVNAPPLCAFGPNQSGNETDTFQFDAGPSSDPDGTIVRYDWDFGDGSTALDAGPTVSHTYATFGVYTVKLTVTDDEGSMSMCTIMVDVNGLPLCSIGPVVPPAGNVGTKFTFTGVASTDPDGTLVSGMWDFGDGTTANGVNVMHTYTQPGLYTVTLKVTDNDGAMSMCTVQVPVNDFPFCDAGPGQAGLVGDTLTFDGSGSSDSDGSIVRFDWDFGDGASALDAGPMPSHVYTASGLYTVTLTVTDDKGAQSVCTTTADVNAPPLCDAGRIPPPANVGELLFFDGSGSSDPDGTIVLFMWDFGDGTTARGAMASHAYSAPGTYVVTLTITDDDGAMASCGFLAPLAINGPPTCDAGGPYMADLFDEVTFDGSGSMDADGSIVRFDWDFGDGTTAMDAGPSPTHTYVDYGSFTITLTVTDDFGASVICTTSLEIVPLSGAIVLSGDDTDQHCPGNTCGAMGPKLIQFVLDNSPNQGHGILAVGLRENDFTMNPPLFSVAKLSFDTWLPFLTTVLDPMDPADVRLVNDPAEFLDPAQTNFDDYRMIFIPAFAGHTAGGITQAMLNAIVARKADLEEYVMRRGGGLYALTEATDPSFVPQIMNAWAWSPIPFGTHDTRYFEVCPSMVGLNGVSGVFPAPLPGTDCSMSAATGLAHEAWHNTFLPDPTLGFSGLEVFALGNEAVVLNEASVIGGVVDPPSFPIAPPRPSPKLPGVGSHESMGVAEKASTRR